MSYILEALKKADQERDLGAVPSLATPHETERPRTRSYRWLWVIAALLLLNAVLVALMLSDRHEQAPDTVQALPERQPAPISPQPAQPTEQPAEVRVGEAAPPKQPVPPLSEGPHSDGGTAAPPEPAAMQSAGPSPRPAETIEPTTRPATARQDSSGLQSWYELPADFRSRLTLPRLDLHVYSEDPQSRFILVDLKKYREGETLESGLLLEEVLPEGMVMSYRGERFLVEK